MIEFIRSENFDVLMSIAWAATFAAGVIGGKNTYFRRTLFWASVLAPIAGLGFLLSTSATLQITLLGLVYLSMIFLSAKALNERYSTKVTIPKLIGQAITLLAIFSWIAMVVTLSENYATWSDALTVLTQLLTVGVPLLLLIMVLLRLRFRLRPGGGDVEELPSVSLCIPARNETHALTQSLEISTDSKYKKYEIIVLDDCSQDKTPQIIRSFAQKGVRFISGVAPEEDWLGKNHAYQQLADHASGKLLLFSGVDVHLQPGSVQLLVDYFVANKLEMMCVVPQRTQFDFVSNLVQSARHYFLLALPRQASALSSCWLISADALEAMGGFSSVKDKIDPEERLAMQLKKDTYRLVMSTAGLITTRKHSSSQIDTARRTLYPLAGGDVVGLLLSAAGLLALTTVQLLGLLTLLGVVNFGIVYVVAYILIVVSYMVSQVRVQPKTWLFGVVLCPLVFAAEFCLLIYSAIGYEFGSVDWKNRDICIPVLNQKHSSLVD